MLGFNSYNMLNTNNMFGMSNMYGMDTMFSMGNMFGNCGFGGSIFGGYGFSPFMEQQNAGGHLYNALSWVPLSYLPLLPSWANGSSPPL